MGKKLFEGYGKITDMNIESVHPVEGIKMRVSFVSTIKGIDNFPSGKNVGSGVIRRYPHGIIDSSQQGAYFINNEQYLWWSHEKLKTTDGKFKGISIVTGYTNARQFLWMNSLIIVEEMVYDETTREFNGIGYQWIDKEHTEE